MIDIKLIRENIKKKFQDHKLILVDEVLELDKKNREAKLNGDNMRQKRKRSTSFSNNNKFKRSTWGRV